MKTFELKTRGGEVINKVNALNIDEAISKFARIKVLAIDSLLELFIVI